MLPALLISYYQDPASPTSAKVEPNSWNHFGKCSLART